MNINTIFNNYDKYSRMIVEEFLKKHDFVEDDNVMEFNRISDSDWSVIEISDYFLNISDIIYDLRNDIDKEKFFEWYDYALEWSCDGYPHVNYNSYLMGFRHKKRNKWQEFMYKSKNKLLSLYYYLKYRKDRTILKEKFKKEFDKINN
jgi:hypothetical protein